MEAQREMAVDVAHFIRVRRLEFKRGQSGTGAVRALEIRVFDECHHGVFRADGPVVFGDFPEDRLDIFIFKLRFGELTGDRGRTGKISFPGGPFPVRGKRGAAEDQRKQYGQKK